MWSLTVVSALALSASPLKPMARYHTTHATHAYARAPTPPPLAMAEAVPSQWRRVSAEDAWKKPTAWTKTRAPYVLTNLPRPEWRGKMMGALHDSKLWYLTAAAYVAAARALGAATPAALAPRALVALATCANVLTSEGYHNADKRGGKALAPASELFWLRADYLAISAVLTTQLWLWAANMGWIAQLKLAGQLSAAATAAVALVSRAIVPKKAGHSIVKLIMGAQFGGLLLYLVSTLLRLSPAPLRINALIFLAYLPGLVLYALKWPRNKTFGFHEIFHSSVLSGHTLSMVFDLMLLKA